MDAALLYRRMMAGVGCCFSLPVDKAPPRRSVRGAWETIRLTYRFHPENVRNSRCIWSAVEASAASRTVSCLSQSLVPLAQGGPSPPAFCSPSARHPSQFPLLQCAHR